MNSRTTAPGPRHARRWTRTLLWAAICSFSAVQAAEIDYTIAPLGSDSWRYNYTLTNTVGSPAFDEFTIYFDLSQVLGISSASAPAGWDVFIAQVDPNLPASGYVDLLHVAGPVDPGSVTSGFSVDFQAAGGLTPDAQAFDLIQSTPFTVVASGFTIGAVPEPGTYALLLSGMALLGWVVRGRTRTHGDAT